jgi:deaminated glutathione amidase
MKVAAIQMISGTDSSINVQVALKYIALAAKQDCELIALPEYFCLLGARDTDKLDISEDFGCGPVQDAIRQSARDHSVWIVAGTLPLKSEQPDRVFNACLVFNPEGELVARYDKMHLFAFDNGLERYDESRVLQAGTHPISFEIESKDGNTWHVGISVCYDLRFPELYRELKADILLVPSAFTYTTGKAHWEPLLRARAIENLAYVIAPAQGGIHVNGRRTWGHSMVIDEWGRVLVQHTNGEGLICAELNYSSMQQSRIQLPALHHRLL